MATTSNVRASKLDYRYELRLPSRLIPALEAAAERAFTTPAEYIRRALIDRLKTEDAALPAKKKAA